MPGCCFLPPPLENRDRDSFAREFSGGQWSTSRNIGGHERKREGVPRWRQEPNWSPALDLKALSSELDFFGTWELYVAFSN